MIKIFSYLGNLLFKPPCMECNLVQATIRAIAREARRLADEITDQHGEPDDYQEGVADALGQLVDTLYPPGGLRP